MGAGLISAHVPQLGDHAIIYLDHVGRIEGETVRHFKGGFCIQIDCSLRKRQKLADQIANLEGQTEFVPDEQRRSARIAPKNANSELRLEDGRSYPITIIDISLSGAAISMEVKPALGSHVWLAGMQGTVIRPFRRRHRHAVCNHRTGRWKTTSVWPSSGDQLTRSA